MDEKRDHIVTGLHISVIVKAFEKNVEKVSVDKTRVTLLVATEEGDLVACRGALFPRSPPGQEVIVLQLRS